MKLPSSAKQANHHKRLLPTRANFPAWKIIRYNNVTYNTKKEILKVKNYS